MTKELDPAWHIAGNHRIRGQKKIAFSYSDPGGTLENKLNDLKPLFSRKKSLTFQKRSKKMLLHWIANLADQNIKQQQLKINMRVTYHTVLSVWNVPLIDTCQHCSSCRANQALRLLANAGFQNRGFVCKRFLPSLPPLSFLAFVSFRARPKPRIPFLGLSLPRNQTETLATRANLFITLSIVYIQISNTYLPEVLNILLYVEVSLMFVFSGNFYFEIGQFKLSILYKDAVVSKLFSV